MDKNPQPRLWLDIIRVFLGIFQEIRNAHMTQDPKYTYVEILEEFNFKFEFCASKPNLKSLPKESI